MPAANEDGATYGFENPMYDGVTTDGDYLAVDAAPETKTGTASEKGACPLTSVAQIAHHLPSCYPPCVSSCWCSLDPF